VTLEYAQAVEVKRRRWQRRIEVLSPKLLRRLTLFSRDAQDAWILLEANPHVHSFCERPAYMEGTAGRVLDFWVNQGRHQKFWVVSPTEEERSSIPKTVNGIAVRILERTDLVAMAMRIANWSQIVLYRICSARFTDRGLQRDMLTRLEKPHRMDMLEAAFHPVDVSAVRSVLFELLATGKVIAPAIDSAPLSLSTIFRRPSA
jgi:hypothetical protein